VRDEAFVLSFSYGTLGRPFKLYEYLLHDFSRLFSFSTFDRISRIAQKTRTKYHVMNMFAIIQIGKMSYPCLPLFRLESDFFPLPEHHATEACSGPRRGCARIFWHPVLSVPHPTTRVRPSPASFGRRSRPHCLVRLFVSRCLVTLCQFYLPNSPQSRRHIQVMKPC
jgi:hypothetical protein